MFVGGVYGSPVTRICRNQPVRMGGTLPIGSARQGAVTMGLPWKLSPLELIHPRGRCDRVAVVGSGCPEILRPSAAGRDEGGADLVILAPVPGECNRGWLEASCKRVARELAQDGVVYLLASPGCRWQLIRRLRQHGIVPRETLLHFPLGSVGHRLVLVPPRPAALRFVGPQLVDRSSRRWRLMARLVARPGGARLVAAMYGELGVLLCRRGAPALYSWLDAVASPGGQDVTALYLRHQHQTGSAVLFRFAGSLPLPRAIIKPAAIGPAALDDQRHRRVTEITSSAHRAGARVPSWMSLRTDARLVTVERAIAGRSAAMILAARPTAIDALLEAITDWLTRWNHGTAVYCSVSAADLTEHLLDPLATLAPQPQGIEAYQHWLKRRCAEVEGLRLPFVAAHNDLTLSNILLERDRAAPGIIDWEACSPHDLPLLDLFYIILDAVWTATHARERSQAFAACFETNGRSSAIAGRLVARLARMIAVPPRAIALCFDACWIRHALAEQDKKTSDEPRPFRDILQRTILNRTTMGALLEQVS